MSTEDADDGADVIDFIVHSPPPSPRISGSPLMFTPSRSNAGVLAAEGVLNGGFVGLEQIKLSFTDSLPKVLMVLKVLKEHGLILAALFGLSAFFSMAETTITTLWPWKVRELAEKESENGVFKMLRNDVTRFLTTITGPFFSVTPSTW